MVDKTPPVWHYGMPDSIATNLDEALGGCHLRKISKEYWKTPVCIASKVSEDPPKSHLWTTQFIDVAQRVCTKKVATGKGIFETDIEHLLI